MISRDNMSLPEAIERLSDSKKPGTRDLESELNEPSEDWDLNTPFSEARELARVGWIEKGRELWKYISALAPRIDAGVTQGYDVSGDAVDVGRYLSGEPENMLTQRIEPLSAVQVVVNISASAWTDARRMFNRGIALAAIIHALQSSGRGVSLVVAVSASNRLGSNHETLIELQRFGDYINPAQLAFWVAHPAALRRCVFRYNEQQDYKIRNWFGFRAGYGYGMPDEIDTKNLEPGTVYIPHINREAEAASETPEEALKYLVKLFKKAGVPIDIETG
ncbi:MAG: hypothetical protein D6719_01575 [Candidatus Dadabacteria bacterium]|nr:MAG: hypothetical protein D6719_01575 [Candidatus Dadabacteria bacterium]